MTRSGEATWPTRTGSACPGSTRRTGSSVRLDHHRAVADLDDAGPRAQRRGATALVLPRRRAAHLDPDPVVRVPQDRPHAVPVPHQAGVGPVPVAGARAMVAAARDQTP